MQRITNDLFESIRKVSALAQEATPTMLNEETVQEEAEQIDELSPSTLTSYRHKARNSELRSAETARRDTEISQQTTNPSVKAKSAAYAAQAQARAEKRRAGQLKATSRLSNEELEQTDEAKMSHQASTTMKHISNPTPGEKAAAKDIKPGIAGYRDRIAMLKSAKARGGLKEEAENITMEFVIENTIEVSVPSTVTYQDYINAIKTIVNSEDPEIQAEIVKIANEAFENDNIEVIAEAELIKQGILEAGYKATRMGDKQYSPELNLDVDRTKPGVTKVSRRIRSGEGKGTTATERRTMKRIASRTK